MKFAGCENGRGTRVELMAPGSEVREASHHLGSFSPRLDQDLLETDALDLGEPDSTRPLLSRQVRRAVLTYGEPGIAWQHLCAQHPETRVVVLSGGLSLASRWSAVAGRGLVFALGGRAYDRVSRDEMRTHQRLLPFHEVSLKTAACSAVEESEHHPLWVSIHLDVLAAQLVPSVVPVAAGGATWGELREAMEAMPGDRVVGFDVVGYPAGQQRFGKTALTAAELLRDNILAWWGPRA